MAPIIATPAQENRMNQIYSVSCETCVTCDSDIWADDETGLFFDTRALSYNETLRSDDDGACCPGGDDAHTV